MVKNLIFVAIGGALGSMARYLLTYLPIESTFPLKTFLTNIIGAIMIGIIVGIAANKKELSEQVNLFLKTGVCGGFTTFSTFSLETLELLENGHFFTGTLYAILSLVLCILGVAIGKYISSII